MRVQPGLTLHQTLRRLNAGFDSDADLPQPRLNDGQRAEWGRIVDRVSRELGPVESEEYLYCSGPAALEVMELAYRIARIVEEEAIEEESHLTGHDFEVGQFVDCGPVDL
ncbi:hypothetical protein [Streptomyces noursei]|uniref:hypothetical protein n=1 Tax=Streptomyces noursei TaxID=1971 RepID=UPI0030F2B70A